MTDTFNKSTLNINVDVNALDTMTKPELVHLVKKLSPALNNLNDAYNILIKELIDLRKELLNSKKEFDELQIILSDLRKGYLEMQSLVDKIKKENGNG